MGEGNGGLEVGAVDEAAARPQPQAQPAEQRVDLAVVGDLAHREVAHPPAGQEGFLHRPMEVVGHLHAGGKRLQAGVHALGVDALAAERARGQPVERGRLVQAYERVGVVPVTTRRRTAIDDGDGGVGFPQQHVDETHRHGAGSLDQVIDFIVHDAGS